MHKWAPGLGRAQLLKRVLESWRTKSALMTCRRRYPTQTMGADPS